MASPEQDAYCTLLMSDDYLPGAMVLAHSLRDSGTKKQLAVLVTLDTVLSSTIGELKKVYDFIIPVDRIVNKSPANLYLMDRPDLISTFTKIALWRQTQFRRIVYLDSDIVALRAPDELFARESSFAAVPDIGWPDCFNSGVLALTPNMGDYYALLALAQRGISFDGADQGLLNMHFRDWDRLSFAYNCTPSASYQYVPAYKYFQNSINAIHYIGHEKPWKVGRESEGSNGVYGELLGRWWAVYERHFRAPTTAYISGQGQQLRTVQQYVKGEESTYDYGFSTLEPFVEEARRGEIPLITSEPPLTEQPEPVESIVKGDIVTIPTIKQQQFSAPQTEWDPIREAPPMNSRPEAANFNVETYTMSADRNLYQAPKSYPEPPKNMWYEVPDPQPANERPKPIFPWEENQAPPTRVFAEDKVLSPEPTPSTETDLDTIEDNMDEPVSPPVTTTNFAATQPFAAYSHTNAWDEMPEIERYISALALSRRAKLQPPQTNSSTAGQVLSPDATESPPPRRLSMKLTDFPTELERPSLPVTPAPQRRPSFWGEERDAAGDLPGAEGVPKQEDWDPLARLDELQRHQAEVLAQGPALSPTRDIPQRMQPESAVLLPSSEESIVPPTSVDPHPSASAQPPLQFEDTDGRSGLEEGVFSSTGS